jgi:hypothetical protein
MKVYLGKYKDWVGPYQVVEKIFFWLDKYPTDEDLKRPIYKLQEWVENKFCGKDNNHDTVLTKFCQWVNDHKHRTEYVKIDYYDAWNANHTLALIILPVLKSLKEKKHGSGIVDLGDVPDELWPKQLAGPSNNYSDDTVHERWNWVLDEIIWAFEQEVKDDDESQFYDHSEATDPNDDLTAQVSKIKVDRDGLEAHQLRKANGLRLFGKYYQSLWD